MEKRNIQEQIKQKKSKFQKRMENENYKAIRTFTKDEGKDYLFVSYKSDDWESVLAEIVYRMNQKYNVRVYFDKEFDTHRQHWTEQFTENMNDEHCKAVLAFISENYATSYATLTELLYSQRTSKGRKLPIIPINIGSLVEGKKEEYTGLGDDSYEMKEGNEIKNVINPYALEEKKVFMESLMENIEACEADSDESLDRIKELAESIQEKDRDALSKYECSRIMAWIYRNLNISDNPYQSNEETYENLMKIIKRENLESVIMTDEEKETSPLQSVYAGDFQVEDIYVMCRTIKNKNNVTIPLYYITDGDNEFNEGNNAFGEVIAVGGDWKVKVFRGRNGFLKCEELKELLEKPAMKELLVEEELRYYDLENDDDCPEIIDIIPAFELKCDMDILKELSIEEYKAEIEYHLENFHPGLAYAELCFRMKKRMAYKYYQVERPLKDGTLGTCMVPVFFIRYVDEQKNTFSIAGVVQDQAADNKEPWQIVGFDDYNLVHSTEEMIEIIMKDQLLNGEACEDLNLYYFIYNEYEDKEVRNSDWTLRLSEEDLEDMKKCLEKLNRPYA